MVTDADFPQARFEAARVCGKLTQEKLWLRYIAVGGHADLFDIDAHLNGVAPLTSYEQDVLAYALNERLDELYQAVLVPYLTELHAAEPVKDLNSVIAAMLDEFPPHT